MTETDVRVDTHRNNTALEAAVAENRELKRSLRKARVETVVLFIALLLALGVLGYIKGIGGPTSHSRIDASAQLVDWSKWTPSLACDVRRTQYSVVTAEHLVEHLNARAGACVNGANQSTSHVVFWRNRVCIEYASPEAQCLIECASPSAP